MKNLSFYENFILIIFIFYCTACSYKFVHQKEKNKLSQKNTEQNEPSSKSHKKQEKKQRQEIRSINKNKFSKTKITPDLNLNNICFEYLKKLPKSSDLQKLKSVCKDAQVFPECYSTHKKPIFHYEKEGTFKNGKKILAIGLIHGDEYPSGSIVRSWMERLTSINPRNSWRTIPISNPDGWLNKTRTNINKVDLNRNFPTKDWDELSLKYWAKRAKSNPRKYPGPKAGSEKETQCIIKHIEDFNPDFIISVHTPLGVLDFDGPNVDFPHYKKLPWIRLGNFPGSLGRYMWVDKETPVLTIELKGNRASLEFDEIDQLQDISGLLAIIADLKTKNNSSNKSY